MQSEPRMSAEDRRASILAAAGEVFGAFGYVGATTDQVARAAGISQPYVVRMFGSKERLFIEVVTAAKDAMLDGFRATIAAHNEVAEPQERLLERLGEAYLAMTERRNVHQVLMQAFVLGHEPVIGARAREGFLEVWNLLRDEAGLDAPTASQFVAQGMLINVLLGTRMPVLAGVRADADELMVSACGPGDGVGALVRSDRDAFAG